MWVGKEGVNMNILLYALIVFLSYLLGCEVRFANYEDIGKSLKPFSLKVR